MNFSMLLALQSIALSHASMSTPLRGNFALAQFRHRALGHPEGPKNEKFEEAKKLRTDVQNADENAEALSKIAGVPTTPPVMSPEKIPEYYLKAYWTALSTNIIGTLLSVVTPVLLSLLCGCCYKYYKEDPPPQLAMMNQDHNPALLDKGVWRYGFCDCLSAPRFLCLMACCCPAIRWADTMRLAGFASFFTAIFLFAFLSSASTATAGLTGVILLCMATMRRQQLRAMFSIPSGSCGTYLADCFLYCLCPCCAIVQEARQMEEAYYVRHRVTESIPQAPLRGK